MNDALLREHLRLKVVETLIRIEHLPLFSSEDGLAIFGQVCEMAGRACTHVAAGRPEQALKVVQTIGLALPHAFVMGRHRDAFEEALDELIAVLERPEVIHYH